MSEKTFNQLSNELTKLHVELRQKALRITLISLTLLKEKPPEVVRVEKKLYSELSKSFKDSEVIQEIVEEMWIVYPPPSKAFDIEKSNV